jgi:hypothetical protein
MAQAPRADKAAPNSAQSNTFGKRELTMPRLYMVTLPGLDVKSDWRVVHDRLLDDFPKVSDVLPTTTPATLLIVYQGRAHVDEWLDAMSEGVLLRRTRPANARRLPPPPAPVRPLIPYISNQQGHPA